MGKNDILEIWDASFLIQKQINSSIDRTHHHKAYLQSQNKIEI
jgi:hypothetical protein